MANVCKACYFHIHALRHVRQSLPGDVARIVACSIVGSRLDYCNSLFVGMTDCNFKKLHRVQNTLPRVVLRAGKFEHITPALIKLHWLPVIQRVLWWWWWWWWWYWCCSALYAEIYTENKLGLCLCPLNLKPHCRSELRDTPYHLEITRYVLKSWPIPSYTLCTLHIRSFSCVFLSWTITIASYLLIRIRLLKLVHDFLH